VAGLAKKALTEEDKRILKVVSSELFEIRRLVDELAETLVKLSDKELLKAFNADRDNLKENQVDSYKEKLEKQLFIAEKEFRT